MRLPDNSLGVSDAMQYHRCPRLFFHNMMRHVRGEAPIAIAGQYSMPLAYGNAVHEAALLVVQNPNIYLDDAVDAAWQAWAHLLEPEHHAEIKQDVAIIIERTQEATNLRLIAAERDMKVELFTGNDPEPNVPIEEWGDEREEWYNYRFKIDALYVDTEDPTHYVIRDFKTYRRMKWQEDIDNDMQFTAYSWGVKQLFPNATRVTIWVDQVKHGETFSMRTERDEAAFVDWMTSTIRAILRNPSESIANTPTLNDFCAWCPILDTCAIKEFATDFALSKIAHVADVDMGNVNDISQYVYDYETAKQALKALEEYKKRVESFLKDHPGTYAGREYYTKDIKTDAWPVAKVAEVVGPEEAMRLAKPLTKTALDPIMGEHREALEARKSQGFGYTRLYSKEKKG